MTLTALYAYFLSNGKNILLFGSIFHCRYGWLRTLLKFMKEDNFCQKQTSFLFTYCQDRNERHISLQIQLFAPSLSIHSPLEPPSFQRNPYRCTRCSSISSSTNITIHSIIPGPSQGRHGLHYVWVRDTSGR
jgi:hypothetical protein